MNMEQDWNDSLYQRAYESFLAAWDEEPGA
mgnify:CR=1 FL=1